jgi:hypothetical protein
MTNQIKEQGNIVNNQPPKNAKEKEFGLKDIELRTLQGIQALYVQQLSLFLSFIALERLAYQVTEKTQFRTEGNRLFVWEDEPEQPDAPSVSTGDTPTADVIKRKKK